MLDLAGNSPVTTIRVYIGLRPVLEAEEIHEPGSISISGKYVSHFKPGKELRKRVL